MKNWGWLLIGGLVVWGLSRMKPAEAAPLPPQPTTPVILIPQPVVPAVTSAEAQAIILQAVAAGQSTVVLPPQVLPSGEVVAVTADVASIVAAAEMSDTPVDVWLDYLGPAPTGEIVYTPTATGVYESALPVQETLRDTFASQTGVPAPAGGVFTMYSDGTVRWQSDPVHPEYIG